MLNELNYHRQKINKEVELIVKRENDLKKEMELKGKSK